MPLLTVVKIDIDSLLEHYTRPIDKVCPLIINSEKLTVTESIIRDHRPRKKAIKERPCSSPYAKI